MTTSRDDHSSIVALGTLYLLGHDGSPTEKTTEKLNIVTRQVLWTKSFDLQATMNDGCTIKTSHKEIFTIAGDGESSRKMFKYNVRTGDAVQYYNLPPTKVLCFLEIITIF